jgi:hypothetical protein
MEGIDRTNSSLYIRSHKHSSYHYFLIPTVPVNLPGKTSIRAGSMSAALRIFGLKPEKKLKTLAIGQGFCLYLSLTCSLVKNLFKRLF